MPERAITENIDFSKSEQYTLSIRLSTEGFSFSIFNPINDKSVSYISKEIEQSLSLAANVKVAIKELDFLHHPYKRINILLASKRFTLIPMEYFDDDLAEAMFYHNHSKLDNELVLYNTLKKTNIAVAFSIDKSAYQQLSEKFPNAYFYSQATPLCEFFAAKSKFGNSQKMYAYIKNDTLDIFCFDRGRMLFANAFTCKQTQDRVYYLLYVWKQLNFNQERDELHLTGTLEEKEMLTKELKRFLQQLFIINPSSEFNLISQTGIEDVPFDMQTLSLYEL